MHGTFCDVVPLDHRVHGDELFGAYAAAADDGDWTYLPYGPWRDRDEFIAWLRGVEAGDDPMFFTIIDHASGTCSGLASYLRIDPANASIEVGHVHLARNLQRTAAATEAMYLMMRRIFETGYRRYEWKCDDLNAPSRTAAARLGFRFEGIFRQATHYKGRNRDTAWYSIIDADWPAFDAEYRRWLDPSNFDPTGNQRSPLSCRSGRTVDTGLVAKPAPVTSEAGAIAASAAPASVASLAQDLRELGVREGGVYLVHSSLSALGWVAGGAQAVVMALLDVVGEAGTIVMPTQSGHIGEPGTWVDPPVPAEWVAALRESLPAYDPYLTPTRGMGQIVECFRQHRATLRSPHPLVSFAACGPAAEAIVGAHPLSPAFGESSPLARLYELDASVLLLGVGHRNNTSFHLAEHRAEWPGTTHTEGAPVMIDGERQWVTFEDLDPDDGDFERVGDAFAATGLEHSGTVGRATARLFRQRDLIDFATRWMSENRSRSNERR